MTTPPTGPAAAGGKTALTDEDNVGWKLVEETEPLSEEDAYWRLRGMIPPARVVLEE